MIKNKNIPASCQLLSGLDAGGIARETVDITRALVKGGGKTIVISGGGLMLPDMLRSGARHILMNTQRLNPLANLLNAWKISRVIKKNDIRILHVRSIALTPRAVLARRFQAVKLIATVHDLEGRSPRDGQRLQKALLKFDHVVAVSRFMADRLRDIGFDDVKINLIPRGIDMDRFDPEKVRTHRVVDQARKWRLPDGLPVILVPSRLAPSGGQAFLIETLARMKDMPFICIIPGDEAINPDHRQEIERLVVRLGLDEHVRFVGFCDDMPAAYMLADVVVTPGLKPASFGRVAVEAQAMARPLITAGHGGGREAIIPHSTALTFAPGDSEALEKSLRKALTMSADERSHMGLAARRQVMQHYTLEAMCAGTLDLYARCATEGTGAAEAANS